MRAAVPPVLLALAALLAGCTGAAPEAAPLAPTASDAAPPPAAADASAPANATAPGAPRTFPPHEHAYRLGYYADLGERNSGNMAEAVWDVPVPEGARSLRATANFTGMVLVGSVTLMVHNGTAAETGDMLARADGPAPPLVLEMAVPEGARNVVLMAHPSANDGSPASAGYGMDFVVVVEFFA